MADELTPIAQYMADEMNRNLVGTEGRKMKELNSFSSESCIRDYQNLPFWQQLLGLGITPDQCVNMQLSSHTAALLIWAEMVRQDGPWDHKPKIAKKFHPRVPNGEQVWHLYTDNMLYYYDVWSNLHYGYVGKGVGFSDSQLLDGAGLEQIGSNIFRGRKPQSSAGVSGLRKFDNPEDRIAIIKGIDLYKQYPKNITAKILVNTVITMHGITKKPFAGAAAGK